MTILRLLPLIIGALILHPAVSSGTPRSFVTLTIGGVFPDDITLHRNSAPATIITPASGTYGTSTGFGVGGTLGLTVFRSLMAGIAVDQGTFKTDYKDKQAFTSGCAMVKVNLFRDLPLNLRPGIGTGYASFNPIGLSEWTTAGVWRLSLDIRHSRYPYGLEMIMLKTSAGHNDYFDSVKFGTILMIRAGVVF